MTDIPVTKEYLRSSLNDLRNDMKEHVSLTITPLVDKIEAQDKILYGPAGRDGLIGDVRDTQAAASLIKWLASIGGVGGIWASFLAWFK